MGDSNKLQKALNAAKTTKKNVKDISSGDFAKKKAEEVKNKAKSKLRNKIILLAIKILVPVLIILLIAGFFMAIIGGIGEIVEGVVSAIRGDIDGGTIGECIVRFDEEKFEEMKNTLKANGINPEASNLTDECLKAFILAQYRTQYPTDVKLRIQISDEEYDKIMQKGGAKGYNFVQEGNDRYMQVNGCIKLYRPEFTGNELRYADEESLNKWIDDNNFFQAEQYYSLDKAGNLIIPEKKEEKYIESEWEVQPALIDLENENYDWESFNKRNGQEKIEVTSKKIPYKSLIANYTMPFEFLTLLTTFTQNSEYGMAVAELVNTKSDIEINILDNSKTTEERQTWQTHDYAYINYKIGGNTVIPSKSIWRSYNNYRDFSEFFDREDNMEMLWNPSVYGYPKNIYKVKRANTITTEYTSRLQIQKAETWFVKKTSEYAIENIDAHLDESVENNPNIQDIQVPGSNSRIGGSVSENDFTSLEDLYNTNSSFKRFIDIMFEGSVDKFRNEILSQIDYKSIMENYADTYVDHYMKDAFFESELNRACPSPTYDDTYLDNYMANLKNYYNTNDAAIKMYQDYYSGVKNIILDYKNKSRDWKIDSNSYEVLPSDFNYERKKYQLKNENYVSEKKYNEIMGKNEDNTDDFISLLVTENAGEKEYVYYETQSGKKAPLADILSAPDMFFELLANNSKTANLEDAMRYILYKITDKDFGVTEFRSALNKMNVIRRGSDFDVTDKTIFITDKEKLKQAILSLNRGPEATQNLLNNVDVFLEMQEKYGVSAAFCISIAILESQAGTAWGSIDSSTYNWCSVSGSYNGQSYNGWRVYSSFAEATMDFGDQVANNGFYVAVGNTTISQIGQSYCQPPDEWIQIVQTLMKQTLEGAGVDISAYSRGGNGSGVVNFALSFVGQGIYDVLPIGTTSSDGNVTYFGADWCAMFVSYCFDHEGLIPDPLVNAYASCTYLTFYSMGKCKDKEEYTPQAGDIVFFGPRSASTHTGIVVDCDGSYVYTVEGNTSGSPWTNSIVDEHSYPIDSSYIIGYYLTNE